MFCARPAVRNTIKTKAISVGRRTIILYSFAHLLEVVGRERDIIGELMLRRSFLQAAGAAGVAGASVDSGAARTRYYTMESLLLENGEQVGRLHDFMSHAFIPSARKVHTGPMVLLEALVAPHVPQFLVIAGFGSVTDALSLYPRLHQQEGYTAAVEKWEGGATPPYVQTASALLEAADYSPEFPTESAKQPRIFELRTYHSPTWRQLGALHQRFSGREVAIFHRSGIHPLFYTSTVFGSNLPNLTYLIPFDDLAAREKAWSAFGADPEWTKVRKESVAKDGEIASVIQISLFKATAYSPFQ